MMHYALIGYPLGHSFSKKYFTEKFEREHIDAVFSNFSLETLDEWPVKVEEYAISGFAVTIPHKRSVIPLLHEASEAVQAMNACNCVVVSNGKWYGHNTDVIGFERSFFPLVKPPHTKALLLGTGGAASAVQYVLERKGIAFKFVSRTPGNDRLTYRDLNEDLLQEYKIIINCSPVGTYPDIDEAPAIPYDSITSDHYLYDLIYNPGETRFLKLGAEKKATVKNGYEMLALQAEENWKIWNAIP